MTSTLNIILFGETGVGKSSVINLLAGREVAPTSGDTGLCTLSPTPYPFQIHSSSYTIWDTRGFDEADMGMGMNGYLAAIEQAYNLIQELTASGGVDLLVLCHRKGRITSTTRSIYRLFYEVFCDSKVPIALVTTYLERHARMEDWWDQNEKVFEKHQIKVATHACVTGLFGHSNTRESKLAIETMLGGHDENGMYHMPADQWYRRLLRHWAEKFGGLKKRDVERFLRKRCGLSIRDAHVVAGMLAKTHDSDGPDESKKRKGSTCTIY